MATKRKAKKLKLSPAMIAGIIGVIVIVIVLVFATSGQTAKFYAAGKEGAASQFQMDKRGVKLAVLGTIEGTIKNACTNSGIGTTIYLDGTRYESDGSGHFKILTSIGTHTIDIPVFNNNGLLQYKGDSADFVTEIKEQISVQARKIVTKNYDVEPHIRFVRIFTNVQDVSIPYIDGGANKFDCRKETNANGCPIGPLALGTYTFDVQHSGVTKQATATLKRCEYGDATVNF